jgi:hypothetical protein
MDVSLSAHESQNLNTNLRADYPSYELFTDAVRTGIFASERGRQLRLIVGEERKVQDVIKI